MKKIAFLARLLFAALLLVFIMRRIGWQELAAGIVKIDLRFLSLSLAASLLFTALKISKWHCLLAGHKRGIGASASIRSYLAGMSLGILTPARVGELGRFIELPDVSRRSAVGLVMADKLLELIALMLFALYGAHRFLGRTAFLAYALAVLLLTYGVVLFPPAFLRSVLRSTRRALRGRFDGTLDPLERLFYAGQYPLRRVFSLSLLSYAALLTQAYFLLRGFGSAGFRAVAAVIPLTALSNIVPLTIAGLGVREGLSAVLLDTFSVSPSVAVDLSLLIFAMNTLIPALCGLYSIARFR